MIKLKMKGQDVLTNNEGVYDAYIVPTPEYGLNEIPAGPNPRDLDPNSQKVKDISAEFLKDNNKFLISNGGMQVIIDDDSLAVNDGFLTFTCDEGNSGHYDGQHTEYAVSNTVASAGELNNCVKITLIEQKCFDGLSEIRGAATAWNSRTKQKVSSEHNILGHFDTIKNNIHYTDIDNVGWKQNQVDTLGVKIRPENEVQQVLRLLATFLPLTYENGMDLSTIAQHAKGAENTAMRLVQEEPYATYMRATYKHTDFCLGLSDFIQESLPTVLGIDLFSEFALIKQTSKGQLQRPITKRAFHKQSLFNGNGKVDGALDKDWMPLFVHALVSCCFNYDAARGEFVQLHDVHMAKAIWLECGREALKLFNTEFTANFTSIYKSRKADFINQPSKWAQISNLVSTTEIGGQWRKHFTPGTCTDETKAAISRIANRRSAA